MLHVHRRGYVAANVQFPFKKRIDPEQLFLARGDAAVCRQFSDMKISISEKIVASTGGRDLS